MPVLLVSSLRPLAGKTAIAVGIGQNLRQDGRSVRLIRLAAAETDEAARADALSFASLALSPERPARPLSAEEVAEVVKASSADMALVVELPAALSPAQAISTLGGAALLVERSSAFDIEETASVRGELGDAFAGVILTAAPQGRIAAIGDGLAQRGIASLALLPEDRLLASPTIGEMSRALEAEVLFLDARSDEVLERLTIASISADPGQDYFARFGRQAVIVRCDKPDLQLAALNASSQCLILSGGGMPLAYVSERAEAEGVPLLITAKGTVAAVQALEELYFKSRFSGRQKADRIGQLLATHLDYDRLLRTLGLR